MERDKHIDTSPRFLVVDLQKQLRSVAIEHALNYLLDGVLNLSNFGVRIHTALVQNGLVSNISKGENSGSQLHHDYVVRSFVSSSALDQSGQLIFKNSFTLPDDAQLEKMGVVVFAQDSKTGVVLQAMAAPLCASGKL